jgi:hypothetical protein
MGPVSALNRPILETIRAAKNEKTPDFIGGRPL